MVVRPCLTCKKMAIPKVGMMFITHVFRKVRPSLSPPVLQLRGVCKPFEVYAGVSNFANDGLLMYV